MDITKISNLLNKLVDNDEKLKFYHFGELSEINSNPQNNFNKDGVNGRLYPCLDWIVPENISFVFDEYEDERYKMELIFTDLYGYDNKTEINTRTKNEVWRDLIFIVKRFLIWFDAALQENGAGCVLPKQRVVFELNWSFKDRTREIKANFDIEVNTDCIDIDNLIIPEVSEDFDLENYCNIEFCYTFLNGLNQYIEVPTSTTLNLDRTDPITFSCWVNIPSTIISNAVIISKRPGSGYFFSIISPSAANNPGALRFSLIRDIFNDVGVLNALSNLPIAFDVWQHVALTKGPSSDISDINFYINGLNVGVSPSSINDLSYGSTLNPNPVNIGRLGFVNRYYNGCISNLSVFNKALNDNEVFEIFERGYERPGYSNLDGVVHHWRFDELNTEDLINEINSTYFNMNEDNIICENV